MKLSKEVLKIDAEAVKERIIRFIRSYVKKCGAKGIVIGLSGGVDSSTAAALSVLALGSNRVQGLIMPEKETYNELDIKHAEILANKFGMKVDYIDITPIVKAFYKTVPVYDANDRVSNGNIKVRTRMICLYYYANRFNMLVCGTTDKSEYMIGYYTKWGDGGVDIEPISDLYKTQVRQLALHIGVPKEIVEKPSSPRLWPGHKAEDEIGLSYEVLDLILYGFEHFMTAEEVASQLNLPLEVVLAVKRRWLINEHKRRMAPAPKLFYRTAGADFRLPILIS